MKIRRVSMLGLASGRTHRIRVRIRHPASTVAYRVGWGCSSAGRLTRRLSLPLSFARSGSGSRSSTVLRAEVRWCQSYARWWEPMRVVVVMSRAGSSCWRVVGLDPAVRALVMRVLVRLVMMVVMVLLLWLMLLQRQLLLLLRLQLRMQP